MQDFKYLAKILRENFFTAILNNGKKNQKCKFRHSSTLITGVVAVALKYPVKAPDSKMASLSCVPKQ